jgi:hypothetical protein
MRFTLTTAIAAAALLSSGAGTALASTNDGPPNRIDALNHAATMRSLALLHEQLEAQGNRISARPKTAPATTARIVAAGDGFRWVDGAIGAGVTAAALLTVAGVDSARRRPSASAH